MANFDTKNKSVEELPGGKATMKEHGTEYILKLRNRTDGDRQRGSKLSSRIMREGESYKESLRVDKADSAEKLDAETLDWADKMAKLYNTPEAQAELARYEADSSEESWVSLLYGIDNAPKAEVERSRV